MISDVHVEGFCLHKMSRATINHKKESAFGGSEYRG